MIRLGMHTDNWRASSGSFETACETAEKYKLEHVEFGIIDGQYFIQAMGYEPSISLRQNPIAIRRYCEKKGLKISQIDGSYPMMGIEGTIYGIQYVQQSIRFARDLGCPKVDTTDSGNIVSDLSKEEVFKITIQNYRECLKWAEDYKIIINVETHGPYTGDAEFMGRLFKYFDSEYLKFNLDTGNTFISGLDPLEYLKIFRKYLTHCHIKDISEGLAEALRGEETGVGSSEVAIGEGVNAENIKKCINYLKETNWDGDISIECFGSDEKIRKSVEFLRPICK